ncbi:MAG: hypothetical protein IIA33_09810, partial [Planctomycetes bacterium]|nr:hypothetical protein [Planctomycetota bacterium]
MPICLNVDELRPGMQLYQAVCNDYIVLLPPGKILDQRDVDTLRRKYPDMNIKIADPLLDDVAEFQDDSADRDTAMRTQATMHKALGNVRKKLSGRAEIRSADVLSLKQATAEVMQYLKDNPVTAILLEKTHDSDTYLQEHSSNVFYVSMVVGNSIKQYILDERQRLSKSTRLERTYALNLTPLAMGCLLQDIGMLSLKDIYNAVGELTAEQRRRLQQHPLIGEKMLPQTLSSVARMVVRTHHENFNGTGYPNQISGEKLHVFSRIIRIADAFDAATSPRIYKRAKSVVRVLWEMVDGPTRAHFDPVITKVLSHMLHPFPVGAKLKLSNGMTAVVVRQNRKASFYPSVIIAFDDTGQRFPKEQLKPPINLQEHGDLKIVAYNGDLSYLGTTSAIPADAHQPKERTKLFA